MQIWTNDPELFHKYNRMSLFKKRNILFQKNVSLLIGKAQAIIWIYLLEQCINKIRFSEFYPRKVYFCLPCRLQFAYASLIQKNP